uniref:NP n=1 Tax=Whidbey virus TaxID=1963253 RepID=A0A1S6PCZ6_9ORTO|nr:NP [Whidbey virus]
MKCNVIKLLLHWHEYMRLAYGKPDVEAIDDIADLTSHLHTIHNRFRQENNGTGSLRDLIKDDFVFEANKIKIKFGDLRVALKAIAALYGFNYTKTEQDKKAIGTLSSILSLISAYRGRFSEVRLGNAQLLLRKKDNTDENLELEQMRLNNTHSPFLTGCRLTPSTQSSMKQSLGPLTIAVNLAMNTDQKFADSWKNAFSQAFKLIRGCEEIANLLSGSKKKHNNIIRLLGDLCQFGITRTSNKAFIPMSLILQTAHRSTTYKAHFAAQNEVTDQPIEDAMLGALLHNLDFSGHGLLDFWNALKSYKFTLRGDPVVMTPNIAGQAFFHAVFGTHKENLNLLEWMTGQRFNTRREFGEKFQKRCSSKKTVSMNIIPFKYFSKLVSAAQTDFLRGGVGQVARAPTFSGRFTTEVSNDSELYRILRCGPVAVAATGATTEEAIRTRLESIKMEIELRLQKEKKISYGTTDFYAPVENGDGSAYGEKVASPGNMADRFYYQHE